MNQIQSLQRYQTSTTIPT